MFNNHEPRIGSYTKKDLKETENIILTVPLKEAELKNLKYIKNNTTIKLTYQNKELFDEEKYYTYIKSFLNQLMSIKKSINIQIKVTNRELLRQSKIINNIPNNINLKIENDEYVYTLEEYMQEEKKLEEMIIPIRESNLSPFEKYLAVYDLVKNFKPYKENKNHSDESRDLRYILSDNNDYIVCAGFTKLLTELLNRINIPSKYISVNIDTSYDKGEVTEEKNITFIKHARNLVKIDDEKYNIHGYYLADSTWDNKLEHNLYLNCLLTFDQRKEAKRLEKLNDIDLLLDFHNLEEFKEKIQYFIKKGISYPKIDASTEEKMRKKTYKDLYLKIIDILKTMDKEEYQKLYNKYNSSFNIDIDETTSYALESLVNNFLIDYAKYVLPLSNNKVDFNTILDALINVKKEIYSMSDDEAKEWFDSTNNDNQKIEDKVFPYIYDPSIKREAYVETKEEITIKK